jgi:hypothetical protein
VCSEEKYELPRGTMPHKQATHLISPNPSSEENPWLTSYFPEEYTVCHTGTTQPESAKFATHPQSLPQPNINQKPPHKSAAAQIKPN